MPWFERIALVTVLAAAITGSEVAAQPLPDEHSQPIRSLLSKLEDALAPLRTKSEYENLLPDVEIYGKAGEWILRHAEFYKPQYADWTIETLEAGLARAEALRGGTADWESSPGQRVLAYRSQVDDSVQPYSLLLPREFDIKAERRWPLHVVLHGRDANLTEVSFIHNHRRKEPPANQNSIQLDIFGRTNNAYRWAGETDVLEALADVKRRYRIDERRIVLHGFSMGGAGSWHLGLHYPSLWCSVGPGAGFVDFYKYQKVATSLPEWQDRTLHIYNAIDYALNAFDVPVCTYGGELDEQLVASTSMVDITKELGIEVKLLIGPQVGHKFHPETLKEFNAFHRERQSAGRPLWNDVREVKFVTWTSKYNTCDWITVEEQFEPYKKSTVEARVDADTGRLVVKTDNVAVLQISRDVAEQIDLDGDTLPLLNAAEGLLPGVYYEGGPGSWQTLSYESSLAFPRNADLHKRRNLQGPIDDAFMQPFVCVRGTGKAWNSSQAEWTDWTLKRFTAEFDKWMRGKVQVIDDTDVTSELFMAKNLILFGDPGSNSVLAKVLPRLPVKWDQKRLVVNGKEYDPGEFGLSMIYPNPLHPRRYVVINSGHTFHADAFQKSNAWLFPRLGDIAVQKFAKSAEGGYDESTVWATIFDRRWKLPGSNAE